MTRGVDEWPACAECGFVPRLESVSMSLPADHPYWRKAQEHCERYRVHVAHETRTLLSTTPLPVLERRLVAPIRKQFGSWVVSHYGVECLTTPYTIPKRRLNESWLEHMSEKLWVIVEDFAPALAAARLLYASQVSPKTRFVVFRRDNYRCQLCGLSAQDGAVLHVDHKVPRVKGGSSSTGNLWTLCFDCNLGKGTQDL